VLTKGMLILAVQTADVGLSGSESLVCTKMPNVTVGKDARRLFSVCDAAAKMFRCILTTSLVTSHFWKDAITRNPNLKIYPTTYYNQHKMVALSYTTSIYLSVTQPIVSELSLWHKIKNQQIKEK